MMQNPSAQGLNKEQPQNGDRKDHARWDALVKRIKSIFLHNWGMKLVAILIAIALWAGLITQDPSLLREKHFSDVPVTVIGAESLKRNGYIVLEHIEDALNGVSMRVSVPQGNYAAAQASSYSVRVDLSRIRTTGAQEIRILSTNSSTYGTVTEIVPATVQLTVDEYVTRYRIPVTVVTQGEPPEGFHASDPATDPPMVTVSGPKSLVQQIVSAQVVADQATLPAQEGLVRRALPFTLVDESGAAIQSDMLEVTSESVLVDSIIVEQTVYTKRTVELSELSLVTGQPAEGYEIKGVYITPGVVTIAGRASSIMNLDILYLENSVNVKGLTESVTKSLRVRQPSSVKYASTDQVEVAVEIGPIITTRAYEAAVVLQGLPPMLKEVGGLRTATVTLTGPQPWLDSLSASDVSLACDLSSIAEPGTYMLPITCTVKGDEGQSYTSEINPAGVVVTVIKR